jgi:hypothetical protein
MMVLMMTQLNPTSAREFREVPMGLAQAYGENAGCYKVQATCLQTGALILEWKEAP